MANGLLPDVPDTRAMSEEEKARKWRIMYHAVEKGFVKPSPV